MNANAVIASFDLAERLEAAIRPVRATGFHAVDAYSPFPVHGAAEALGDRQSALRVVMAIAGFGTAAVAYGLQWYSAVIDYPFFVGGRPLDSWPVFVFFPFELGIFAAAAAGFLGLLWRTGMPRLHDPLFDCTELEDASRNRFVLVVRGVGAADDREHLRRLMESLGAVSVRSIPL